MAELIQPNTLGDGIRWEHSGTYSREKVTAASGQNLALLEVVGKVTADGKVVALDPAAVDGSEVAAGIMVAACDASTADKAGAAIVRDAMIDPVNLVWPAAITTPQKTQALAELKDLGIVAVATA
ncbi:MAG: head decoration protein [Proteobacteria bacterium]|nr:head decoration protein [Pseudomonadota bacterium]